MPALVKCPAELRLREFYGMYTVSPRMERLFVIVRRVARADSTVLLTGETGSGKELLARALHALSSRSKGPFKAVNCATLSSTLLESSLFGHVRGAFTGAVANRPGLFRLAHKGQLFLDEVTEIPLDIQGKLLRVLQERTFVPVGGTNVVKVDVRVVSATNRSLSEEVAARRFREDLSYRVRVVPIELPPLRERKGDVDALFWHFLEEHNRRGPRRVEGVTREFMQALRRYPWPGNVRELLNVVEYAYVTGEGPVLSPDELTPELRGEASSGRQAISKKSLAHAEREHILAVLARHNGSRVAAAAELGISRSTLWRKLQDYSLKD